MNEGRFGSDKESPTTVVELEAALQKLLQEKQDIMKNNPGIGHEDFTHFNEDLELEIARVRAQIAQTNAKQSFEGRERGGRRGE